MPQQENPSSLQSDLVTDMAIGMSDGFLVPFAITSGLYHAAVNNTYIVYAGIAVSILGALFMGLARYVSAREEAHEQEHGHDPDEALFIRIGLSEQTRKVITEEMAKDKEQWEEMMQANELPQDIFKAGHNRKSAVLIAIFYAVAGLITVLPYWLMADHKEVWLISSVGSIFLLTAFGFFKGKVMNISGWRTALHALLTGVAVAAAAYFLGHIFR